jgi:leucyl aminopeptidase (aminopeptidase T)
VSLHIPHVIRHARATLTAHTDARRDDLARHARTQILRTRLRHRHARAVVLRGDIRAAIFVRDINLATHRIGDRDVRQTRRCDSRARGAVRRADVRARDDAGGRWCERGGGG